MAWRLSTSILLCLALILFSCSWQGGSLSPLARIGAITAGGYHTCVLTLEGTGYGSNVPLFESTSPYYQFPRRLPSTDLSSSPLDSVREVLCWGADESGQLGDGTELNNKNTPVAVAGLRGQVSAIAPGGRHMCALTAAGGVFCWGNNDAGQLGDGTETNARTPVDVLGLTNGIIAVEAGGHHTCALSGSSVVKYLGDNEDGQLGDGTTVDKNTPVDVMGLTRGARVIAAGGYHTCAVNTAGSVLCWGNNDDGELGAGGAIDQNIIVEASGLTAGIGAIAAGELHTCALTTAGAVKCWGDNSQGQLGNGTTIDALTPVDVVHSIQTPASSQIIYARRF